jgi:hypothetical protein
MTLLTLAQNVELFKRFAYLHKSLGRNESNEHFFFGDSWEKGASDAPKYPLMQVGLVNDFTDYKMYSRTFRIEFTDLVNKGESNELYVQSDMNLLALDFLLYMERIKDSNDLGITISENVSPNPFTEKYDDEVTGYGFEFTVSGHIGDLACMLPIVSGNYFENNYIFVGGANAGDFQVLIKDQDGNTIQTFNTSGEYVVTVLSGIKDTITSNVTTITDDII